MAQTIKVTPNRPTLGQTLGSNLGAGLGQSLTNLLEHKLQGIETNKGIGNFEKLGYDRAEAKFLQSLPPKEQREFIQYLGESGYNRQRDQQQNEIAQQRLGLDQQRQDQAHALGQQKLSFAQQLAQSRDVQQQQKQLQDYSKQVRDEEKETAPWHKELVDSYKSAEGGLKTTGEIRRLLKDRSKLSGTGTSAIVDYLSKGHGKIDARSWLTKNSQKLSSLYNKLIIDLAQSTGYRPSAKLLDLVEQSKLSGSLSPEANEFNLNQIEAELKRTVDDFNNQKLITKQLGYRPRNIAELISEMGGGPVGQSPNQTLETPQRNQQQEAQQAQEPQGPGEESDEDWLLRQATRTTFRAAESIGDLTRSLIPTMQQALGVGGPIGAIAAPYLQEAYKHIAPTSSPKGLYKKLTDEAKDVLEPQGLLESLGDKLTQIAVPLVVTGTPGGQALKMAFGGVIGEQVGSALENVPYVGKIARPAGELAGMVLGGRIGSAPKPEFGKSSMAFSPETVELETAMGNMFDEGAKAAAKLEVPAKSLIDDLHRIRGEINEFKTPASKEMTQLIDSILSKQKYTQGQGMTVTGSDITKGIKRINSLYPGASGETKNFLHDISSALKKEIPTMEKMSPEFKKTYSAANEVYKAFKKSVGESERITDRIDKTAETFAKIPLKNGWLRALISPSSLVPKFIKEGIKIKKLTKASPVAKQFLIDLAQAKIANNANAIAVAMRNLDNLASKHNEQS